MQICLRCIINLLLYFLRTGCLDRTIYCLAEIYSLVLVVLVALESKTCSRGYMYIYIFLIEPMCL